MNFPPRGCHPQTELNILDRRQGILLCVESAELVEHRPAYRATTRPERRGTFIGLLVDVVVHEVLVLRQKIAPRRRRIVGPEQRGELWIAIKFLLNQP